MNIILISLPQMLTETTFEPLKVPPLALYLLGGIMKQKGHNVRVIDPCQFTVFEGMNDIERQCKELIESYIFENDTTLLAFSINSFNWGITKLVVNKLDTQKFKSKIHIVFGGLHVSIFDEYALKNTIADIVIRGEGDLTFPELVDILEKKESLYSLQGITFRKDNNIIKNSDRKSIEIKELEKTAYPDYSLLPIDNPYIEMPIESSRGCLFSCAFCSIPHRYNWRGLSKEVVCKRVEVAVDAMKYIRSGNYLLFVDDCFTINPERAVEILTALYNTYGPEMKYFIEVRISNILTGKLLNQIPKDIISGMQIGVECGYDDGLRKIKKGLTVKQLYKGLDILEESNLTSNCFLSFIIGFPWETSKEINMTLDTVEYILNRYHIRCVVNWLLLLPSDLWNNKEEYGINIDESVFDDALWFRNRNLFYLVHPLICEDDIRKLEERIMALSKQDLPISYARTFEFDIYELV